MISLSNNAWLPKMKNLNLVSFNDIVVRHGKVPALELVRTIETLAQIQDEIVVPIDQEVRFRKAIEALSKINFAS